MSNPWPLAPLGEVLTERQEVPSPDALARGEIRILAKIGFDDGLIQLRTGSETKTGMILIRPGDLVVSGINAAKGAIAIYDGANSEPIAATIHYGAYVPRKEKVDAWYLWWLLRSGTFRDLLLKYVPGGIKTELKASRLLRVPVPLPPIPQQRRIVARIEELAANIHYARTLRQHALNESDALLKTARRVLISDFPGATLELQEVCAEIIDNLHSNPRYAETGIPCIRSPDVGYGTLNLDGALCTDEDEYRRRTMRGEPQPDDIVLVREGGGTGKCALVLPGQRFSLGQRVMMLRPDREKVLPKFLLHQLLSPLIQEDQMAPLSKGSASPHLNIGALKQFSFRFPSITNQQRMVAKLDALQAKVDALKKLQAATAAELDAMLPSILDKALKGELRRGPEKE